MVTAAAAVLLCAGLTGRGLWQDEAETALLAENVLRFGRPVAFDGKNRVSQEVGREFGADYLWRWSPWVQFYLPAPTLALLGRTTLAARLPFVLLGLATVPLTYLLARRLFGSVGVARLSALFLTLSVPFLLHARQARWHAPAYLAFVWLLLAVAGLAAGRRLAWLSAMAAAVLLFYTNYFVAIGTLAALMLAAPVLAWDTRFLARLALALVVTAALAVPGILFFQVLGKEGALKPEQVLIYLARYSVSYFAFVLPMPVLALVAYVIVRGDVPGSTRPTLFLLIMSASYLVYLSFAPWQMFRYLSVLLPAGAILTAVAVDWLWRRERFVGAAFVLVLIGTDILHQTPLAFVPVRQNASESDSLDLMTNLKRSLIASRPMQTFPPEGTVGFPLAGYFYEALNPGVMPEQVLADYLKKHGKPDDVVLISYGDLPLQFYTDLRVTGGLQGPPWPDEPDWLIPRVFTMSGNDPGKDGGVKKHMAWIDRHHRSDYEPVLQVTDSGMPNNPDPYYHWVRIPTNLKPFIVWHRKK
jgi:hypothetical protein